MEYKSEIITIDKTLINFFKKISGPLARLALFIIFFWFGLLKVFGESPADQIVEGLMKETIAPFISFPTFFVFLGLYEAFLGILFLIPKATRLVIPLLLLHMATTFLPLLLMPSSTWNGFLIPTLEGQYIIKNLLIVALAIGIAAHLHPIRR